MSRPEQFLNVFVNEQTFLLCVGFYIRSESIFYIYILQWPKKKSANLFFLSKSKSSEKQKCVNILFLSKSKILKRLSHGISKKNAKL